MRLNRMFTALGMAIYSYSVSASEIIEPIMVTIPAGSFDMGSDARESTKPIHSVNLKQFSLGKYEVTVAEFRQFIEATNYPAPQECRHELNGWFRPYSKGNWETNNLNTSEFQPVVCINWNAAQAYTEWLAKETGKPYRLPTEAEWEYAARAGTKTDYWFGNDEDRSQVCEYANTADLYGENILQRDANTSYKNWSTGLANCVDHSAYASIVGMYKPNPFGLHDMISNVLEMLSDCYVSGYTGAPTDGSARIEESCERRSTRGGSWHWNNWPLAQRGSIPVDFSGGVDGFRIALDGQASEQSAATQQFAAKLNAAQIKEQKRRAARPEFPAKITDATITQKDSKVTLTWTKSTDETVDSYRVYRNEIPGGMYKLIATNIKEPNYTEFSTQAHKYEYAVVAVNKHMQGEYSEPLVKAAGWMKIPARLEAQWAAEFTGTSLSWTSDVDGGHNFTGRDGISENATMLYQIDVPQSGHYALEYRVAAPRDTKGFEIFLEGKKLSTNTVNKTGGYHEWSTQQGVAIQLPKGNNTLTIKSLDKNWKLNWLSLNQVN